MDEAELKREIILDNYQNPMNRGWNESDGYIKVNTNNSSCIDNIDLWIKIRDRKIEDIRFEGEACAISTASTSIMIKELIGKSLDESRDFIKRFYTMIEDGIVSDDFNEAVAFDTIYKQANRKTCATLPYKGILDAFDIYEKANGKI